MRWLLAFLFAASLAAAAEPQLFFSRAFPGSAPEYFDVALQRSGAVEYREAPDEADPLKLQLTQAETDTIYLLAEKLDNFGRSVESPAKVAFMGKKTLRFDDGQRKNAITFNYTEDPAARELTAWFERIAESARNLSDLERTAKYDKLGVVKSLQIIQSSLDGNRLVGAQQFLPMLDRIAANSTYMHTARARASEIAEAIRNPKQ